MRPPNLSVQMPSGTRISEPVSTGVAVSRPNSVALRSSVFLIGMPITPNIIQTMKHTVNASVLTISTDQRLSCSQSEPMLLSPEIAWHDCRPSARPEHPPMERAGRRQKNDGGRARIVRKNYSPRLNGDVLAPDQAQAVLGGDNGGLHARAHVELAQDVLHVDLDRGLGDVQLARDLLVAGAARDAAQDLPLARRQHVQPVGRRCRGACRRHRRAVAAAWPALPRYAATSLLGHLRADHRLAASTLHGWPRTSSSPSMVFSR